MRLLKTDKIMLVPNGALAVVDENGRMLAYKRFPDVGTSASKLPKTWDWLKSGVDKR
jgi:hypothetical protein